MKFRPDRFFPSLAVALGVGMLLTGCDSSPSGNDGVAKDGSYMTALVDGKPWQAEIGAGFPVRPPGDTGSDESMPRGVIGAGIYNANSLSFDVPTDRPDSVPLDSIGAKHVGELTGEGNFFFTRSGYVKITGVSDSWLEGTFACEMEATINSAEPFKVIQVTNGKFRAKAAIGPTAKSASP